MKLEWSVKLGKRFSRRTGRSVKVGDTETILAVIKEILDLHRDAKMNITYDDVEEAVTATNQQELF